MRRVVISVATITTSLSLAGCGALNATGISDDGSPAKGNDITVGLLLPEKTSPQYGKVHYPVIKAKVESLTRGRGRVEYANAAADADTQSRQLQHMIDERVDVILLDAVDTHAIAGGVRKAKKAGIPVIAYLRLAEGPIDAYVSFDNELVGELQGRSLIKALGGTEANPSDKIVMMNGPAGDPNAEQFKAGALVALDGKVTIARSYDTKGWKPETVEKNMTEAVEEIGKDNIKAVYSAYDGFTAVIVKTLKAAGMTDLPPITGQDAQLSAVQRIITGEQYMSVYKSSPHAAEQAAEMAVKKVQGKNIQFDALTHARVDSPTNKGIPAEFVPVVGVTKSNIADTVIKDGVYELSDICTAELADACAAIGLRD